MNSFEKTLPNRPRRLRRLTSAPYDWKKPRKDINIRDIKKVRISTKSDLRGVLVYPEFYDDTWKKFYEGEQPLVILVRYMKISGIEIGNSASGKLGKIKSEWEKWLKDWIKDNHLHIKFDDKKIEVKPIEKIKKPKDDEEEEEIDEEATEKPLITPQSEFLPPLPQTITT